MTRSIKIIRGCAENKPHLSHRTALKLVAFFAAKLTLASESHLLSAGVPQPGVPPSAINRRGWGWGSHLWLPGGLRRSAGPRLAGIPLRLRTGLGGPRGSRTPRPRGLGGGAGGRGEGVARPHGDGAPPFLAAFRCSPWLQPLLFTPRSREEAAAAGRVPRPRPGGKALGFWAAHLLLGTPRALRPGGLASLRDLRKTFSRAEAGTAPPPPMTLRTAAAPRFPTKPAVALGRSKSDLCVGLSRAAPRKLLTSSRAFIWGRNEVKLLSTLENTGFSTDPRLVHTNSSSPSSSHPLSYRRVSRGSVGQ